MQKFEIGFDELDEVEAAQGDALIKELEEAGAKAEVRKTARAANFAVSGSIIALIAVSTASVAGLAVVAAFIQRVFGRGVLIDLRKTPPRIEKNPGMPAGSLLIIYSDGREEFHEGIPSEKIAEFMGNVLTRETPQVQSGGGS